MCPGYRKEDRDPISFIPCIPECQDIVGEEPHEGVGMRFWRVVTGARFWRVVTAFLLLTVWILSTSGAIVQRLIVVRVDHDGSYAGDYVQATHVNGFPSYVNGTSALWHASERWLLGPVSSRGRHSPCGPTSEKSDSALPVPDPTIVWYSRNAERSLHCTTALRVRSSCTPMSGAVGDYELGAFSRSQGRPWYQKVVPWYCSWPVVLYSGGLSGYSSEACNDTYAMWFRDGYWRIGPRHLRGNSWGGVAKVKDHAKWPLAISRTWLVRAGVRRSQGAWGDDASLTIDVVRRLSRVEQLLEVVNLFLPTGATPHIHTFSPHLPTTALLVAVVIGDAILVLCCKVRTHGLGAVMRAAMLVGAAPSELAWWRRHIEATWKTWPAVVFGLTVALWGAYSQLEQAQASEYYQENYQEGLLTFAAWMMVACVVIIINQSISRALLDVLERQPTPALPAAPPPVRQFKTL
jgi:hypothetical protein